MARKKISEFRAKTLLNTALNLPYSGVSITPESNLEQELKQLDSSKLYVVKVDQGVKKRGKQGLVKIKIQKSNIKNEIENLKQLGFRYFLVEEFVKHESSEEKYLAMERIREGIQVYFSDKGGVEVEENEKSIEKFILPNREEDIEHFHTKKYLELLKVTTGVTPEQLEKLVAVFEINYFSFLELNPFLVRGSRFTVLDAAVEIDSAAEFFIRDSWTQDDFRDYSKQEKSTEEKAIASLAEKSQASFSLTVLNPNGSLFMLLSGGGASIVLADEAYNQGKGESVANYGEYSGNPNTEETYLYTKQILRLLLRSNAPRKALIVGGGVANFTDIRHTFKGVIQALNEEYQELHKQKVKIFVRRGGPHQEEGLANMKKFLEEKGLYGSVHNPDTVLTDVVKEALEYIK